MTIPSPFKTRGLEARKIIAEQFARKSEYTVDDLVNRTGLNHEVVQSNLIVMRDMGLVWADTRQKGGHKTGGGIPTIWVKGSKPE